MPTWLRCRKSMVRPPRRVFPDHRLFTSRKHVQNTGFAIRRGLPFRCGEYRPLSLNGRVRRGAELVLFPGEARELHLLSTCI
ncbi:MAG: hypothetical protein R3E65_09640 [Steroidobacteraceae bacterium]